MTKEKWLENHTKQGEIPPSTVQWLKSLEPNQQDLARRFPPSCVVESQNASLACPRKGHYGLVVNYLGENELKVIPAPYDDDAEFAGMCNPQWLKIVGYWNGLDSAKVVEILGLSTT